MGLNFSSVFASCVTLCKVVDVSESQIPLKLNEVENSTLRINHPAMRICTHVISAQVLVLLVMLQASSSALGPLGERINQVLALQSF